MSGQTDMPIQSACRCDFSLLIKTLAPAYDVFGDVSQVSLGLTSCGKVEIKALGLEN